MLILTYYMILVLVCIPRLCFAKLYVSFEGYRWLFYRFLFLWLQIFFKWRTTFSAEKSHWKPNSECFNFKSKGCWAWAEANGNLKIRKFYTYINIIKCYNSSYDLICFQWNSHSSNRFSLFYADYFILCKCWQQEYQTYSIDAKT